MTSRFSNSCLFFGGPVEVEVYTLTMNLWREIEILVDLLNESSIINIRLSPCLFFSGAMHSIATYEGNYKFILSFNVDDERFHGLMLPQNYLLNYFVSKFLAMFKESLALITFSYSMLDKRGMCHIMKEYGVSESWTQTSVPMGKKMLGSLATQLMVNLLRRVAILVSELAHLTIKV